MKIHNLSGITLINELPLRHRQILTNIQTYSESEFKFSNQGSLCDLTKSLLEPSLASKQTEAQVRISMLIYISIDAEFNSGYDEIDYFEN